MNVTCTSCRRLFTLGEDWMKFAVGKAEKKKHTYYNADCPHCRRAVRVAVAQMKRNITPEAEENES